MDLNDEFYGVLKRTIFGAPDGKLSSPVRDDFRPRATFHLNREFDDLSPYLVYDFFVELFQEYGSPIQPIEIKGGCIMLVGAFGSEKDYSGRDFRDLVESDPVYHKLFSEFGVDAIYLQFFPTRSNRDHNKYALSRLGQPQTLDL